MVQLAPGVVMAPAVSLTLVLPTASAAPLEAVNVPPQELLILSVPVLGSLAKVIGPGEVGKLSVNVMPVRLPLELLLVIVNVSRVVVPAAIGLVTKFLTMAGSRSTTSVALATPPAPPSVELTAPVVLT